MKRKPTSKTAKKKPVTSAAQPKSIIRVKRTETADSFPIVGIGASAGGLEALELFFNNVPDRCGIAFVIVQHLDPTHKGMMVELLQRSTSMKIAQTTDRMKIRPDCVYIIPPNKDMSVLHGVLHLLDPVESRGLRLPIDFFFRSLADDRQELSIGVILSGMGTDGTLGIRAMKEKAGAVFVQDTATAKFDGMPRSAIESGMADVIAPVEELPSRILAYLSHKPIRSKEGIPEEETTRSDLEKVVILLRTQTGHDFSNYKRTTIYRRIERRMSIHQIDRINAYVRFLQHNPKEVELLFKELLIGVTSFFRDGDVWTQLQDKVIPSLLTGHIRDHTLRAWVAGCSTGEEAYSLAIIFKETVEKLKISPNVALQIFATDLDMDAIDKAREGIFPTNIAADVSQERLNKYFLHREKDYQVSKQIRDMVVFARQNIIMDPPFTKLDIVCCRNLLIYLTADLQKKLIPLFHYALNPRGILFLGSAETIGGFSHLFTQVDSKAKIFRKNTSALTSDQLVFPTSSGYALTAEKQQQKYLGPVVNIQTLTDRLLLKYYSSPAVLVNSRGDIIYISGRTGKFLEPAAGKANWNIFAMAKQGLRYELGDAFQKAVKGEAVVNVKNIVLGTKADTLTLNLTIHFIKEPGELKGLLLIVFKESDPLPKIKAAGKLRITTSRSARIKELEREIESARQQVQIITEEMQTSQEELRSSNEELQSTNEELQSTNEELTTSKEEMQSLNEELQTINHELQINVEELSRTNNDMKNLLDSTDIATLFLDNSLRIRRFTQQTTKITKLIASDVGRPITDIASDLFYPAMAEDVNEVLRNLLSMEKQVVISSGQWYLLRILPYRTLENTINGVVITYSDITVAKMLELKLRKTQEELESKISSKKEN